MKKNKKKNKIARRIVLSTLTFSSLLGVGLSLSSISGFDLKEENLVNNQEVNEVSESANNIDTKSQKTALIRKPGVNFSDYYPFEIPFPPINTKVPQKHPFWDFFSINGTVNPETDSTVTFMITNVIYTNKGDNTSSGILSITAEISRWSDEAGVPQDGKINLTSRTTNMRSVTGSTNIVLNPTLKPITDVEYASDIVDLYVPNKTPLSFIVPINHIENAAGGTGFNSTIELNSSRPPVFDNTSGTLTVSATIKNYIDSRNNFVPASSGSFNHTIDVPGFKRIYGPTGFSTTSLASSTTPSVLLRNANADGLLSDELIKQFFGELKYPLTIKSSAPGNPLINSTELVPNKFFIKEANDKDGTVTVEITVKGGYYGYDNNGNLVPIRPNTSEQEQTFSFVVAGFSKFIEQADNTLIIVSAAIGGGVGFIALVVGLIFFIRFQKKKTEEIRKKKSMDDKLHSMSSKPKKGPEIANASMGPGPGGIAPGRPGAPGGPQAPGKYVPPTISVPKSNAPVVKRPSGPTATPPTPPTKK
ncbi:MAG: hypothetical protein ACRDCF_00385 [Mycoplasmoidaceae bacterium]